MKVAEAIEQYLSAQRLRGLEPSSVRTTSHALRTVLEPVINDEVADLAAEGVVEALRIALGKRVSRTSRKPLTECTQELYVNAAKAFFAWVVGQGWIQKSPLAEVPARAAAAALKDPTPPHAGKIIRNLREAAGLTRIQMQEQTRVQLAALKAVELGRRRLSRGILDRLLSAPCLARLPAMAAAAGILLPKEDEDPGDHGHGGSDPGRGST